ncbi:MAG TPA: gliding motility lipoprotein GldH [Sphingobacteriaceae bacterium]
MKALNRLLVFTGLISMLTACANNGAVIDTNQAIIGENWSYINKVRVPVTIDDEKAVYSIFVNLRHTGDYKYSNIFLLIHQVGPDGRRVTERREFKLANPDGEWLGSGSGSLYSYQLPFKDSYRFPQKGKYVFEIEQNMRDNPLKEVTDAGLRVEKVE